MTTLEYLRLVFRSSQSRLDPENRPLPPPTRFVLSTLTELRFEGVHEYLEDLLARIDAPRLDRLFIVFFMDFNFDLPQLHRLIGHFEEFNTFDHAGVWISAGSIRLRLSPKTVVDDDRWLVLQIKLKCRTSEWQLSSLAQICSLSFPIISASEELEIRDCKFIPLSQWKGNMEDIQWVKLLNPFTTVKDLYLTNEIAQRVCGALSRERATEVLPALRNIFVGGSSLQPVQEAMTPFVAARQLSGHPIVIER
jgi:hypothetical protein